MGNNFSFFTGEQKPNLQKAINHSIVETKINADDSQKNVTDNLYPTINVIDKYDHPQLNTKITDSYDNKYDNLPDKRITSGGVEIFKNQMVAAEQILEHYKNGDRAVVLSAPMQSGKTGVAVHVADEGHASLNFENIFFICGMSDNSLKNQAKSRFNGLDFVKICFNPDLQKYLKDNKDSFVDKRVLVIVDESHYGSEKDEILQEFLLKIIGLDPAQSPSKWANKNSYYMSISATPFTEEVANYLFGSGKKLVHLNPGSHYKGVKYFLDNEKIKESFKLENEENYARLVDELKFDKKRYYIIRSSCLGSADSIKNYLIGRLLFSDENFIVLHYQNELERININDYLTIEPHQPTIIFVFRSLSAGYTPYLNYVEAMFEQSAGASETDIQRFLGRACGYYDFEAPLIYTSQKHAEEYVTYLLNNDKYIYPSNCKYIFHSNKRYCGAENVPFLIDCRDFISQLVMHSKSNSLKTYLTSKNFIDTIGLKVSENDRHILTDEYVLMGTSTASNDGKHETIKSWWANGLNAYKNRKVWYKSHKQTKAGLNPPSKQKYVYLNLMVGDPYYGYLMFTSMENCREKETNYDVRIASMYHQKSSHGKIRLLLKLPIIISNQHPNEQKITIILKKSANSPIVGKIAIRKKLQQSETNSKAVVKKKKAHIPAVLRKKVWDTYIGEQIGAIMCPICQNIKICQLDFDCGHVLAEANDGDLNLENLRAICSKCNTSMGKQHMKTFTQSYFPDAPILSTFQ